MKRLPSIFTNTYKPSNFNFTKIENIDVNDKFIIKIKLTNSCSFNCDYCCFHYKDKFITLETIRALLKAIKDLKIPNILFVLYGGEPTLHPQFYNIIDILKKYGEITILTNMSILLDFKRLKECSFMFTLHTKYISNKNVSENLKRIKGLSRAKYDLVLLVLKDNYKDIKRLYNIFKMMYNTSIGYVFQDVDKLPDEILNLFNDNVIKVSHNNVTELLSYQKMIKEHYTNFYGCKCDSGMKMFILNSDGAVYRCESDFLNKRPLCDINDLHNNLFKAPEKCHSYWCTEYWSTITHV